MNDGNSLVEAGQREYERNVVQSCKKMRDAPYGRV